MFFDFLKEYIPDLIECSDEDMELTSQEIHEVAAIVDGDEHVWETIETAILDAAREIIEEREGE